VTALTAPDDIRRFYSTAIAEAAALCAAEPAAALLRDELLWTERQVDARGWSQAPVLMSIHTAIETVTLDLCLGLTTALRATIRDHRLPVEYFLAELADECEIRASVADLIPPFPGVHNLLGMALLFESATSIDSAGGPPVTIRGRYLQAATGDGLLWTVVRFRTGEPFCYLTRLGDMLDATGTIPHTLSRIARAVTGCNTGPAIGDDGTQEA